MHNIIFLQTISKLSNKSTFFGEFRKLFRILGNFSTKGLVCFIYLNVFLKKQKKINFFGINIKSLIKASAKEFFVCFNSQLFII